MLEARGGRVDEAESSGRQSDAQMKKAVAPSPKATGPKESKRKRAASRPPGCGWPMLQHRKNKCGKAPVTSRRGRPASPYGRTDGWRRPFVSGVSRTLRIGNQTKVHLCRFAMALPLLVLGAPGGDDDGFLG
jgi:hypothetical protein